MNLAKVIKQIKSDITTLERKRDSEVEEIILKYNVKIEDLNTALKINMEMNTACLECDGRGIVAFCDASGNTERDTCEKCNGSGLSK